MTTAGWREWADLPALGLSRLKAKMDTGARSSSLHAEDIEIIDADELNGKQAWVRFRPAGAALLVEAPLLELRAVKDSGGHVTVRPFIQTILIIGSQRLTIELSLIGRAAMLHPLIIGRQALRGRFSIDPNLCHLLGRPQPSAAFEPVTDRLSALRRLLQR